MYQTEAVERFYSEACDSCNAMAFHYPTLRSFASECEDAVEFGVKGAGSSSAILSGGCRLTSYDVVEHKGARRLEAVTGDRWLYRIQSSLEAEPIETDLLFIDSLHTFEQCDAELKRHADLVRKFIVFHDTITFGVVGAVGETGKHGNGLGIRPAIDNLMIRSPEWRIAYHSVESHGLLVLRWRP